MVPYYKREFFRLMWKRVLSHRLNPTRCRELEHDTNAFNHRKEEASSVGGGVQLASITYDGQLPLFPDEDFSGRSPNNMICDNSGLRFPCNNQGVVMVPVSRRRKKFNITLHPSTIALCRRLSGDDMSCLQFIEGLILCCGMLREEDLQAILRCIKKNVDCTDNKV